MQCGLLCAHSQYPTLVTKAALRRFVDTFKRDTVAQFKPCPCPASTSAPAASTASAAQPAVYEPPTIDFPREETQEETATSAAAAGSSAGSASSTIASSTALTVWQQPDGTQPPPVREAPRVPPPPPPARATKRPRFDTAAVDRQSAKIATLGKGLQQDISWTLDNWPCNYFLIRYKLFAHVLSARVAAPACLCLYLCLCLCLSA